MLRRLFQLRKPVKTEAYQSFVTYIEEEFPKVHIPPSLARD